MHEQAWIEKLKQEGFTGLEVHPNAPNTEFSEHTHDQHTVHVILAGELTVTETGVSKTMRPGERFEIPAGTTHSAKCGPKGCTFIVGVKVNS